MPTRTHQIQAGITVENCIKCGRRPVIEQTEHEWIILCSQAKCENIVRGKLLNFEEWNRINKKQP